MTRSRRHAPYCPNAAASDAVYKRHEHRRERAAVRRALLTGESMPHPRRFGNPWRGPKDGKHRLAMGNRARWMRK